MLRINLLPSYVAQRRLSKRLMLGFAVLFLALLAGMSVWYISTSSKLAAETQLADQAVQGQQNTQAILANAQTVQASVAPIQTKVDFVKAVHQYNLSQVRLYWDLANYTDPKVIYTDASYSGATMTIKAYTPSFREILTYLPRIRQDPDFISVTIDHVPSYADAYETEYLVGKTLVAVGTPPGGQGGQGQGGPAGSAGFGGPGGQGGFGGGRGGFGGFGNGPGGAAPGGPAGAGGTQGPQYGQSTLDPSALNGTNKVTPLATLIQRGINPLTLPRQAQEYAAAVTQSVHSKKITTGYFFTVTATLAHPFAPPVYGASGAAGGGQGGPGGPGGGPGGPGGGPGGPGGPPGAPVRTASNG